MLQVQLDYSSLSREHRASSSSKERDRLAGQFQADIEQRAALLAKVAPNLKAMEQYEAVKVRALQPKPTLLWCLSACASPHQCHDRHLT